MRQTRSITNARLQHEAVLSSKPGLAARSSKKSLDAVETARQHNETAVSLLQLPPEIWNRIYGFVIGRPIIHLNGIGLKWKKVICNVRAGDCNFTHMYFCTKPEINEGKFWCSECGVGVRPNCWASIARSQCRNLYVPRTSFSDPIVIRWLNGKRQNAFIFRRDFNLMFICRQTYEETHLLLYNTTIFSFAKWEVLHDFLLQLTIRQRHVLAHLHYDTAQFRFRVPTSRTLRELLNVSRYLPNLRVLHLATTLSLDECNLSKLEWAIPLADEVKVTLRFDYTAGTPSNITVQDIPQECTRFAREIEKVCSGRHDGLNLDARDSAGHAPVV